MATNTDNESSRSEGSAIYNADDADYGWSDESNMDDHDRDVLSNCAESTFCFETDYVALKENSDYYNCVRTLAILEAQRIQITEDIDKLYRLQVGVKKDPIRYLNKLIKGDHTDFPSKIVVQKVPEIDWDKYNFEENKKSSGKYGGSSSAHSSKSCPSTSTDVTHNKPSRSEHSESVGDSSVTVRGRAYDPSKPQTFNQLWTAEEQLRLEELLLEYPPEKNENSRWRKIAQALGNRTTKQVCSRVQKYFKKLTKAGLPIPGHQLKTSYPIGIKTKYRRKKKKPSVRETTFFPTQHLGAPQLLDNHDEEAPETPTLTPAFRAAIIEKVALHRKRDAQLSPYSHPNVHCAVCGQNPLQGTRWRCLVCPRLSLCSACVISQLNTDNATHPPSHPLEPLSDSTVQHLDPDYMPESFQSTNYLDPNFLTTNV